jgi:hypothetical protein
MFDHAAAKPGRGRVIFRQTDALTLAGAIVGPGSIAIRRTPKGATAMAAADFGWSFAMVFAAAALLAATAFPTALRMPNSPLRESLRAVPVSQ